jgi:acetyl esterase
LATLGMPGPAAGQVTLDVRKDVQYGVANGKPLLLDAYLPRSDGGERRPAVILLHGGGFRVGDKASFEPEARKLAARGYATFSVNYRLDEPSAFPAEADDVRAAVRWVRANARELEVDPSKIGALGESAGGTLAALLATMGEGPLDRDARVKVAIAWSGPMDLAALTAERGDRWALPVMGCSLDACRDRFVQASPVTHVDRTDAPLLLINSQDELVPVTQTAAMDERLERAGVRYDVRIYRGTRHALDYRDEAIGVTVSWLERHLADNSKSPAGTAAFLGSVVVVVAGGAALVLLWRRRRARGRPTPVPAS